MAKKRKTLPKDFEQLLVNSNLQELITIFDKCEIEARGGYGKRTALAYDNCPHELAKWLVAQGANLHATDTWGNTPLHSRSRSIFGNIKSLLDLGADANNPGSSIGTPLHAAADSHNAENTATLLSYGAKIDAVNSSGLTPLEQALLTCRNIDIVRTVRISTLHLNAGAQHTPRMKEYVTKIGKEFEFHRENFNKDEVDAVSDALNELYRMFKLDPVAKRVVHDGKSPIIISEDTWQKQHQELWQFLVPSSGPAETVQGEVIRISGRVSIELNDNGGINWDDDYKTMCDTFLAFLKQGSPLSNAELAEAFEIVKGVKQKSGDTDRMCELGVKWVTTNSSPMKLPAIVYKR
jgi:hypothetical protein